MTSTKLNWAHSVVVVIACIAAQVGVTAGTGWGVSGYPDVVIRVLLFCSSIIFVSLLFQPTTVPFDRRATSVMVFAAFALISTLASPGVVSSLARLGYYYSVVLFGLAFALALPHCRPGTGLLVLLTIPVVHSAFLLIALQSAAQHVGRPDEYVPPFFLNIRHFGYQGFLGATAAIAVAILDRRLRTSGLLLAMAAVFGIVVFGSRGGFVAWVLFVIVLLLLWPRRAEVLFASLFAVGGAVVLAVLSDQHGWFNTVSLFGRADIHLAHGSSLLSETNRFSIWRDAVAAVVQRAFFGYGPEGYQISRCCDPTFVHPHNSILQLLLEFGVVGLAALVWSAREIFWQRARQVVWPTLRSRADPICVAAFCIVAAFLGFSLIDGLLYYPVPMISLAIVCGLFLAARSSATE